MPSPYFFTKDQFPGQEFFRIVFAIANTVSWQYIIIWNLKKEDLHFDALCNGGISVGYAKIIEY